MAQIILHFSTTVHSLGLLMRKMSSFFTNLTSFRLDSWARYQCLGYEGSREAREKKVEGGAEHLKFELYLDAMHSMISVQNDLSLSRFKLSICI